MGFNVSSIQRAPRTEQFRLVMASLPTGTAAQSATGCPEGTYRCTVLDNTGSSFTINFNQPFARTPNVQATPLHATGGYMAVVSAVSTTAVTIKTFTATAAAGSPTQLHVSVHGFDTADQVG